MSQQSRLATLIAAIGADVKTLTLAQTNDLVHKAGGDVITASAPSVVPITIQLAASQSADGWQLRNSSAVNLVRVDSAGVLYPLQGMSVGNFGALSATVMGLRTGSNATKGLVLQSELNQTFAAPLVRLLDSTGAALMDIRGETGYLIGLGSCVFGNSKNTGQAPGWFANDGGNAAVPVLVAKAGASQTGDLFGLQNSAGTTLGRFASDGGAFAPYYKTQGGNAGNYMLWSGGSPNSKLISVGASHVVLQIIGAASQTGDLINVQNSAGTNLFSVNGGVISSWRMNHFGTGNQWFGELGASPTNQVTSGRTTDVSFKILAIASQSVALQQWAKSDGTVYASVNSVGVVGGFAGVTATNTSNTAATPLLVTNSATNIVNEIVKGAASQTASLTEWQDSAATVLASMGATGAFLAKRATLNQASVNTNASLSVGTGSTADNGIVVKGVASQSANLTEWQISTGALRSGVDSSGRIFVGSSALSAAMAATALNSSSIAMILRGVASQTADLQQWQNSAATVLHSVTSAGLPKWADSSVVQTTVGAAGGAAALPATPSKYLKVVGDDGTTYVVPAYAAA